MKKIFLVLMILISFMGCSTNKDKSLGKIITLSGEQLIEKMDKQESFVVYVGISTCTACASYKEILKEYLTNHEMNIYYLELDSQSEEVKTNINDNYLKKIIDVPVTYIVVDGVAVDKSAGVLEYSQLKKLLVKYGYSE